MRTADRSGAHHTAEMGRTWATLGVELGDDRMAAISLATRRLSLAVQRLGGVHLLRSRATPPFRKVPIEESDQRPLLRLDRGHSHPAFTAVHRQCDGLSLIQVARQHD